MIAFQLAYLITDGLNMSENFQHKFLFQLNQANKELGRKVRTTYFYYTKNKNKKETNNFK